MNISVSSNIVAGIYFVFLELLLVLLLNYAVQMCFSYHNLRLLHQKKQVIFVKGTRLSFFAGYGITTPLLGRVAAIIGTIVLLLTVIGSFSIDGSSRPGMKTVIARRVVLLASQPEELVDYLKHVSADGLKVSGTYVLANSASMCIKGNRTVSSWYSMMSDTDNLKLDSMEYSPSESPRNASCLYEEEGFRDRLLLQEHRKLKTRPGGSCHYDQLPSAPRELEVWSATIRIQRCKFIAVHTCCAKFQSFFCVTEAKHPLGYSVIVFYFQRGERKPDVFVDGIYLQSPFGKRALQSLAYLLATGVGPGIANARHVARSYVKEDEPVQKLVEGDIAETNINIWLLVSTTGTSLSLTFIFVVIFLGFGRKDMISGNLRGFNAMSSAMDIMACAASSAHGDEDSEVPIEEILVGVSRRVPYVGPLADYEEQELLDGRGVTYDESEIEGRYV